MPEQTGGRGQGTTGGRGQGTKGGGGSTVLVVAPNWLGDAVMALPAIADVRRQRPSARLVVGARQSVAPLFAMVPGVDAVVPLRWKGQAIRREALDADTAALKDARPDLAILFPNSFASAWLARRAAIPERWGYARDVRGLLLTRAVPRPAGRMHQGEYYQNLVRDLGFHNGPLQPVVQPSADALASAMRLLQDRGWRDDGMLVVIAPGAAYGTAKRWLPRHFASLVTSLVADHDAYVAAVGSAADVETTRMIASALGASVRGRLIDLAGATSLAELAAVLHVARVCVSNDSGAMHLAGAVGTPLVALFGPTREDETAPLLREGGERRVLVHPVWCRPCMLRECPIDHRCMRGLEPAPVHTAVAGLLAGRAR